MLVFREEKSHEDEIKAWQFWHSRQHSVKQRILDADTKNSAGIVGPIEEITHNAIAFYWNPLEGPAKVLHFDIEIKTGHIKSNYFLEGQCCGSMPKHGF